MSKRSMAKKKIKDIKCVCGWCSRSSTISNKYDKKNMLWLCEYCKNINEASIEDRFAIGRIVEHPHGNNEDIDVGIMESDNRR